MCLSLLTACSDDYNNGNNKLNGRWAMTSYVADMNTPYEINDGDINWKFAGNNLFVDNTIPENYPDLLPTRKYRIETESDNLYILSEGFESTWEYTIDGNNLYLVSPMAEADGGPVISFLRIK